MKFHYCLSLSVALAACRTPAPALDLPSRLLPPVAVGGGLGYGDQARAQAAFLDLTAAPGSVRRLSVGSQPVTSTLRSGASEVLVLSQGAQDDPGVTPQSGSVTVFDASGHSPSADRRYTVGSPFDGLAQTSDGRYALTYFTPGIVSQQLLFNPNEVALIDLTQPPSSTNPTLRTVRSFGGVPLDVAFSPPMTLGMTDPRTLAVVLSSAYVTLLDVTHPTRTEITVRLTLPTDGRSIDPTQVLFDTAAGTIYLRASASNDVFALHLSPVTPASATDNDFVPVVNQLAAGQSPADMALFTDNGRQLLLVASPGSSEALVVDALSSTVSPIPLDAPADHIVLFSGPSPTNSAAHPQAILYGTESTASSVSFLDLPGLAAQLSQNAESVALGGSVAAALPLLGSNAVMFQLSGNYGQGSLAVLDLLRRTASPLVASVSLSGASFDAGGAALWVAPADSLRVGYVDLATLNPGEIRMDEPVSAVLPLVGDVSGRDRVVALHPGSGGDVTVIDARAPQRSTAVSYRGFLLDGLLDQ